MSGNDHTALNITAYRYVPIGKNLLRIGLGESSINLSHDVIRNIYHAKCMCGTDTHIDESRYRMGLPVNGGDQPSPEMIGVVFGPRHRWIRLHCSGCCEVQWYFREDELKSPS